MEAIGAVAACIDILFRSVALLERANTAWVRQKNGTFYLQGVASDVKATLAILELLNEEEELRQDHVDRAAHHVAQKGLDMYNFIYELDKKSETGGGFKKFVDHLRDGPGEQARLETLRKELNDSKSTLILALQMAQVGLLRAMGKSDIIVNIEVVAQVDKRVQTCPGLEDGLRIAQLYPKRAWKDEKGKWHLNDQDIAELQRPPPYMYKPAPLAPGQTRGVVQMNNVVGATFIGMGIGKDGGDENSVYHPDELIVSNNKVSHGGLFVGGGISARNLAYLAKNMNVPGL